MDKIYLHQPVNETIHTLNIKYACDAMIGVYHVLINNTEDCHNDTYVSLSIFKQFSSLLTVLSRNAEIHITQHFFMGLDLPTMLHLNLQ